MEERSLAFEFNGFSPQRLDKFLVEQLPEFSRSRLQGLIKKGHVTVNGVAAQKGGQALENNDLVQVVIPPPQPSKLTPEPIPLQIIYEDANLMVIDKPAGMVVHPAAGHSSGTVVHAALAHAPEMEGIGGERRPGVVHRLDKNTSGLLLLAKNDRAHRFLQNQFRKRQVDKIYLALVDGAPPTPTGRIEAPVGRDPRHRQQMAVTTPDKGRAAVSEYFTRERFSRHTLLEVHPITGRTHQIRLHMAFIGCPITGDSVYGHKKKTIPLQRHFLHAARLHIRLPGEEEARTFETPLPEELAEALERLRQEATHE
ncbi:MAG TPA: RluA family pseudouridine synthase [Anaerolineales bacterium]|nr:RluA family pseudouridine synthase [Anaerolineales bacterium]